MDFIFNFFMFLGRVTYNFETYISKNNFLSFFKFDTIYRTFFRFKPKLFMFPSYIPTDGGTFLITACILVKSSPISVPLAEISDPPNGIPLMFPNRMPSPCLGPP